MAVLAAGNRQCSAATHWFAVHWTAAGRLVDRRDVLLVRGEAYVPMRSLLAVLKVAFRKHLSGAMDAARRHFETLVEDD